MAAPVFQVLLFAIELTVLLALAFCTKYSETGDLSSYGMFQHIHTMIFVGFGFLMTFMRKYGWGAVGFTYLFAIIAGQLSIPLVSFFHQVAHGTGEFHKIPLDMTALMNMEFCAGAVLISFGGVIGKISQTQMLVVVLLESVFYVVNETLLLEQLKVTDAGGTMVIHAFGAYFGLALSFALGNPAKDVKSASTSHKNGLFAMVGTLFLWMYWPSFNAGPWSGVAQERAVVNTILAIGASTVAAFLFSMLLRNGKFDMEDVQNATLAGGVAVGAVATCRPSPAGALAIGFVAGALSVAGYVRGSPLLQRLRIDDTCGIHNLHGMPAILGALISIVVASMAEARDVDVYPSMATGRTAGEQAAAQTYGLLVTLGIALVGGLVTGFIVRCSVFQPLKAEQCYEDDATWHIEDMDMHDLEAMIDGKVKLGRA